jgi:hypothetical protein
MNSLEIKNRINKIIRNRINDDSPQSEEYLKQIANFIYTAQHNLVDSLKIAKMQLKSPVLYDKMESYLAENIASNIYNTLSNK